MAFMLIVGLVLWLLSPIQFTIAIGRNSGKSSVDTCSVNRRCRG